MEIGAISYGNYAPVTQLSCDRYYQERLINTLIPDSEEYWEAIALLGELLLAEDLETAMFTDDDMIIGLF